MAEQVPSTGTYAYGGYPDIDALYKEQALVTDRKKREGAPVPDPAAGPRARSLRTDLRIHLAERRGTAGRRAGADAHQPVSLVGAARRSASQEKIERPRRA